MTTGQDPRSRARELALQFLYMQDIQQVYYFSPGRFSDFCSLEKPDSQILPRVERLCERTLNQLEEIDNKLRHYATNWSLERMAVMDRAVLRLALSELLAKSEPPKVILNEAIELAKKYSTERSADFVNGILDQVVKNLDDSTN